MKPAVCLTRLALLLTAACGGPVVGPDYMAAPSAAPAAAAAPTMEAPATAAATAAPATVAPTEAAPATAMPAETPGTHPKLQGTWRFVTTADGLPSDVIRDVLPEQCPRPCQTRNVWVATGNGVAHWDGVQWTAYTTADGLPSPDVRGVTWAADGTTLWAATAQGAAYFDEQAWQAYTRPTASPKKT